MISLFYAQEIYDGYALFTPGGGQAANSATTYLRDNNGNNTGGSVSITNCYSTGTIGGDGGGICGKDAGQGGTIIIESCYSSGDIGEYSGGNHQFVWQPENLSSGVYMIQLTGKDILATQKVIYSK